jgi:hypothetical protein
VSERNNVAAVWITDSSYWLPTFASLVTFARGSRASMYLYLTDDMPADVVAMFQAISDRLCIRAGERDLPPQTPVRHASHVKNRLTRCAVISALEEDVVLLLDGDTVFQEDGARHLIDTVTAESDCAAPGTAGVWGVPERERACDSWFYFQVRQESGGYTNVSTAVGYRLMREVFGNDWYSLLSTPSINNGVVAFRGASQLAECWRAFYLKGIHNSLINPCDDQVPMAAAVRRTNTSPRYLDFRFNSLGALDGPYCVLHAWGGMWRKEVAAYLNGRPAMSRYGAILHTALDSCADIAPLAGHQLANEPHAYRLCDGVFEDEELYRAMLTRFPAGRVVEVWRDGHRSACYLAEISRARRSRAVCETLDDPRVHEAGVTKRVLASFDLDAYVRVVQGRDACPAAYADASIDCLIMGVPPPGDDTPEVVRQWWSRIAPGGVCAFRQSLYHIGPEALAESPAFSLSQDLGCTMIQDGALCMLFKRDRHRQ